MSNPHALPPEQAKQIADLAQRWSISEARAAAICVDWVHRYVEVGDRAMDTTADTEDSREGQRWQSSPKR